MGLIKGLKHRTKFGEKEKREKESEKSIYPHIPTHTHTHDPLFLLACIYHSTPRFV